MDRRTFLARYGTVSVGVVMSGTLLELLSGCSTIPEIRAKNDGGSIRIPGSAFLVDGERVPTVVANIQGSKFPIAVFAPPTGEPLALLLRCTHKGCPLSAEEFGYSCSCHGSEFTSTGQVKTGPAKEELQRLPVVMQGSDYIVRMPSS